jgi:pimeloyl-ACP methyl ester carboxylesterase
MFSHRLLLAIGFLLLVQASAPAQLQMLKSAAKSNRNLVGKIIDYGGHLHQDNRIYSEILHMKRDLYVYLPPGYCPDRQYPLLLWLHGGFGDEHSFFDSGRLEYLDDLIVRGCCPPMIVACADGTYSGLNLVCSPHSLYINGCGGRLEDHMMQEVIPFLTAHYSICPDRRCHMIGGISAGGFGAMNLALKHRDFFGIVYSISGALNLRYSTCSGRYTDKFDPETYRWRTDYSPSEVIGALAKGLLKIRSRMFLEPVFGRDPGVVERVTRENPADLLTSTDLKPGELAIYISYGAKDELNMDSQGASFIWLAAQKGVAVKVDVDPEGEHGFATFRPAQQRVYDWLATQLPCDGPGKPGVSP